MQRCYLGLEILAKSRLQDLTRTSSGTEDLTTTAITAQSPNQYHAETGPTPFRFTTAGAKCQTGHQWTSIYFSMATAPRLGSILLPLTVFRFRS